MSSEDVPSLVFVGGGPKTTGILLALAAAARRDPADVPERLRIDIVDPFPVGGGRIWREDQAEVLWMNSLTEDITIFSELPGAITGPTLDTWIAQHLGSEEFVPADGFAPRHVQARYLGWVFDQAVAQLPEDWSVHVHTGTAVYAGQAQQAQFGNAGATAGSASTVSANTVSTGAVSTGAGATSAGATSVGSAGGGYTVRVRPGAATHVAGRDGGVHDAASSDSGFTAADAARPFTLHADALVLAQGYIEMEPDAETSYLQDRAQALGLTYVPPGYTADLDLSVLPAGQDVLVRGFGLAFIDAMMMVTEGRGGTFERNAGRMEYIPSGREPTMWVGSRRGVPLMPKLGYSVPGLGIGPARYITEDNIRVLGESTTAGIESGELAGADGATLAGPVFDLLGAEMAAAHYAFLAGAHPDRAGGGVRGYLEPIETYVAATVRRDTAGQERAWAQLESFAAAHVVSPDDLFDLQALDRPLHHGGWALPEHGEFDDVEARVAQVIRSRLDRAANPHFAQDAAVFSGLVGAYLTLREFVATGFFDAKQTAWIETRVHGFFSYVASGPPPERLENLLALHRAGIVRFLGPDVEIAVDKDEFTATSRTHGATVSAANLLDARLSQVVAAHAKDSLLQSLIRSGELLLDGDGKFAADTRGHALDARGVPQDVLFMVGPAVSGSVAEAFARPGTNSRVFRDNESLAGSLLGVLNDAPVAVSVA